MPTDNKQDQSGKADRLAKSEAREFVGYIGPKRHFKGLGLKRGTELDDLKADTKHLCKRFKGLSVKEGQLITKVGANPPVKVRRPIKPQPIGFLTPLGSQEPYRPRYSPDFRFGPRRSPAGSIYSVAESTAEEQENQTSEEEILNRIR